MGHLDETTTELINFRHSLHQCLNPWGDALFELCDAVLCSPHRVDSVPALSLEPEFRRSHGSLYKALASGDVDEERLRRLLIDHRPEGWPPVFALDASTWALRRRDQSRAGFSLLGLAPLGLQAHRAGLVIPVDQPAELGP